MNLKRNVIVQGIAKITPKVKHNCKNYLDLKNRLILSFSPLNQSDFMLQPTNLAIGIN